MVALAPAPADSSTSSATTNAGHDEALVKMKTTKPLPRAIQLVMTISSLLEPSSSTASSSSMETIGKHGVDRFFAWMNLVFFPFMFIAPMALLTYADAGDVVIILGGGGFVFLAVLVLPQVYLAVLPAARGYLDLFAPQTPYAAWQAVFEVGFRAMGPPVMLTSFGASMLYALMLDKAWMVLVTCAYLLGLLVASTIALWLCLLRTYDDGGGEGKGKRRETNSSCGEAVIDGLAYLYSWLLYEYAARFLADADADAGMQH